MKFPGIPDNEEERLRSLYLADLGNAANLLI